MITLNLLKEALGIQLSDTSRDGFLTVIVNGVNAYVLSIFGLSSFDVTAYADTMTIRDLNGAIWTRRFPVVSVTSILFGTETQDPTGYAVTPDGYVELTDNLDYFPIGRLAVTVNYTAGWASGQVPGDLTMAALGMAVSQANTLPKSGYDSERIGQYSYKLSSGASGGSSGSGTPGIPPASEAVFAQYRRVAAVYPP